MTLHLRNLLDDLFLARSNSPSKQPFSKARPIINAIPTIASNQFESRPRRRIACRFFRKSSYS